MESLGINFAFPRYISKKIYPLKHLNVTNFVITEVSYRSKERPSFARIFLCRLFSSLSSRSLPSTCIEHEI